MPFKELPSRCIEKWVVDFLKQCIRSVWKKNCAYAISRLLLNKNYNFFIKARNSIKPTSQI